MGGPDGAERAATPSQAPTIVESAYESTKGTAQHALFSEDAIARERTEHSIIALITIGGCCLAAAVAMQFSPVRPPTHWLLGGWLLLSAVACAVGVVLLRKKIVSVGEMEMTLAGVATSVTWTLGLAHTGILSFVNAFGPVVVYYFALQDFRRPVWVTYACCAAGHLAVAILVANGSLPQDQVIHPMMYARPRSLWIAVALLQGGLLAVVYLGIRSRRFTVLAMAQLEGARRAVSEREALLEEARAEVEEALGAGKVGRLTGERIGRYAVREIIGRGGMGEVYAATTDTGNAVAVKVLHPSLAADETQRERLFREALVCSELDTPNIARVVDHGTTPDGSPFLAMELLDGHDLASILRARRRLSMKDVVDMARDIGAALSAAGKAGVVHRDVKPQTAFRARAPDGAVWKILDFGISKAHGHGATLTREGVIGTPAYMSPEQIRGDALDQRADIFSLGVIVYRAITGNPAFPDPDPLVVMRRVVKEMPRAPSRVVAIPPTVDLALALAMAKNPDDRLEDAAELGEILASAAQGQLDERYVERARKVLATQPWRG